MSELVKVPNLPFWASPDGTIYNKHGRKYKPVKLKNGYYRIGTRINGKPSVFLVHRLIALTFIDNPNNYPWINHKDEDRSNNSVDNLEWCTPKYNANYGTRIQRQIEHQRNREDVSKPVIRILNGEETRYPSAKQAERELQINNSNIIACCLGKRKTAGGYEWRYAV